MAKISSEVKDMGAHQRHAPGWTSRTEAETNSRLPRVVRGLRRFLPSWRFAPRKQHTINNALSTHRCRLGHNVSFPCPTIPSRQLELPTLPKKKGDRDVELCDEPITEQAGTQKLGAYDFR